MTAPSGRSPNLSVDMAGALSASVKGSTHASAAKAGGDIIATSAAKLSVNAVLKAVDQFTRVASSLLGQRSQLIGRRRVIRRRVIVVGRVGIGRTGSGSSGRRADRGPRC